MSKTEPMVTAPDLDRLEVDKERPFFETSLLKVSLLTVMSFGIYPIYWFYLQWTALRDRSGDAVIPILRAIFCPIFFGALASRIREKLLFHNLSATLHRLPLWILFVLFNLAYRMPMPTATLGVLTFFPLMELQKEINRLHRELGFPPENRQLTRGGWIVVGLGSFFWLMVILAMLLPEASGAPYPS